MATDQNLPLKETSSILRSQLIIQTVILMIMFFAVGWFVTPWIFDFETDLFLSLEPGIRMTGRFTTTPFLLHLLAALSFAAIPVGCCVAIFLRAMCKHRDSCQKDYLLFLVYAFGGYVFGLLVRVFLMSLVLQQSTQALGNINAQMQPQIVNEVSMDVLAFHHYTFVASWGVCALIVLLTKRPDTDQ